MCVKGVFRGGGGIGGGKSLLNLVVIMVSLV